MKTKFLLEQNDMCYKIRMLLSSSGSRLGDRTPLRYRITIQEKNFSIVLKLEILERSRSVLKSFSKLFCF